MVGGGLLLGTLGVFIEEAGQPALTAVWFRCFFGLLALTLWFAVSNRWSELRLSRRDAALAISGGLLMVLNWVMFFEAVPRTSMSVATLVVHVQPFLIMVIGTVWLGERVSRRQWGAALVALVGLGLATGALDHMLGSQNAGSMDLQGIALALGAALAYALVPLLLRRARGASSLVMAWWQCMAGTVALAWWPLTQGWPEVGPAWGWLVGMGVVHTGLAYVLLYAGVSRLPAGRMALLQFVYPASAIVFDAVVYGRTLSGVQLTGGALLLASLLVATREKARA
jgi:RarD protein